jgi:hypothetical protein
VPEPRDDRRGVGVIGEMHLDHPVPTRPAIM